MSASIKLTDAAALQGYVQKFHLDLLSRFFFGFSSAAFLTPYADVKGKLVLTELVINDLVKRHKKTFDPSAEKIEFKPRELDVVAAKIDLQIYPQDFENSYLGLARTPGFNHNQLPFEGYIMDGIMAKKNEEKEVAIWQGDAAAVEADTDPLSSLFDGYLKIIADGITAGDITVVATGALTLADMVQQTESVYKALPAAMRNHTVYLYMSVANADLYNEAYREKYSKYVMQKQISGLELTRLDCGNAYIVPVIGMGTSNRIIATVQKNMAYGFDSASDDTFMNFKDSHRAIDMWMDFKLGPQIGILHNNMIKVNNQA